MTVKTIFSERIFYVKTRFSEIIFQSHSQCLDQSERFLMIRNKNKLMKIGLPDGSLRTHLLDMTIPLAKVVAMYGFLMQFFMEKIRFF
jgi:hypothetical protein